MDLTNGRYRVTCIFVMGCNSFDIRTGEVYDGRVVGVGSTTCNKGNMRHVVSLWMRSLPDNLAPGTIELLCTDHVIIRKSIQELFPAIQIIGKEGNKSVIDEVWVYGNTEGRWDPSSH